jgi:hypothetical protein
MLFTENVRPDGSIGPLLHPMDPIIITLTRLRGRPIQVFTGYCDSTPYLQLFPGTVTIRASCTLKRLMHTYWDPGLDFTIQFLREYGWFPDTAHGGISAPQKELQALKSVNDFNDGSIANLLAAVLINIGGWDKSTIYIEPLPKGIGPLVVKLFNQFQDDAKATTEVQERFEDLLTSLIGSGSFGTGNPGGSTGNAPANGSVKGNQSPAQIKKIAEACGAPTDLATWLGDTSVPESGGNPRAISPTGEGYGLLQINPKAWPQLAKGGDLFDPVYNIKAALYVVSVQGSIAWSGSGTWRGPPVPPGKYHFPLP